MTDFLAFLSAYSMADEGADVNGDGVVSVADFLAFLALARHCRRKPAIDADYPAQRCSAGSSNAGE